MDLKEFLDKESFEINEETTIKVIDVSDLGLFFWERGGRQFVEDEGYYGVRFFQKSYSLEQIINKAEFYKDRFAQDFLDCLACFGEDKVKELIEKEKGV